MDARPLLALLVLPLAGCSFPAEGGEAGREVLVYAFNEGDANLLARFRLVAPGGDAESEEIPATPAAAAHWRTPLDATVEQLRIEASFSLESGNPIRDVMEFQADACENDVRITFHVNTHNGLASGAKTVDCP